MRVKTHVQAGAVLVELDADPQRLELATAAATSARLAHAIEQRRIRAPIDGRLGEVASLQIGAVVHEGDTLGAVVPPGNLRVVAQFFPSTTAGRPRKPSIWVNSSLPNFMRVAVGQRFLSSSRSTKSPVTRRAS